MLCSPERDIMGILNQSDYSWNIDDNFAGTVEEGDKVDLQITYMDKEKKISDIFIDCKIPKRQRDNYPLVVDSRDKIVWIPKIKKSKYNRPKNETCDIIYKCC